MAVVIETQVWEPNNAIYIFLFVSCFLSVLYLPSKAAGNVFDYAPPHSFFSFQRNFLLIFCLSSVLEGLCAVLGEYELAYSGVHKEQIFSLLCVGHVVSLFLGSFLGMLSDLIGHKKLCLVFYILHLFGSVLKGVIGTPVIWFASLCLLLASSIFSFSFEMWMVIELEKSLGNYLIYSAANRNMISVWKGTLILAVVAIFYVTGGWKEAPQTVSFKEYCISFSQNVLSDKKIWLLSCVQACIYFSVTIFWILWAPTIVADGREVSLGLIYPCLMGSRMLGSTGFPWFLPGSSSVRTEECLIYAFVIMGVTLSVVAYDYQEIGILVVLFSLFHACLGVVLPALARLRTMYVPNEVRGGMICLSLMPANAAILFSLALRGYYRIIGNSTILAFAALGLFLAAGCMYALKGWGKRIHQSRRKL